MTAPSTKASPPAAGRRRKNDPESVRADILAVATREFSEKGLSGARIDEIAEKTRASKRMIYYYFNDKETLYLHTLEAAYQKVRLQEAELDLDHLAPLEALSRLVRFTFCHHAKNPDFIRLVMIENIHHGRFLAQSELIQSLNAGVIDVLTNVYIRGVEEGCFREGLDPRELHWLISALSFFNVSNQHTFSRIFDWQQAAPENQRKLEDHVTEMVLRYVGTDATLSQS
ncbi:MULTISPECIES: TetR/AcrR family transcriptional regulator [Halomonadaceae]|uniref:HTH-type transcriptional repressor NicS n=1 Tax=Vreelandella titanicae TaxID=664683 RepID=A0AAP9T2A7_9GAMM|nr:MULTISPECIES: TetR/AcrR family transcriptional regulator [Halomonas]QGQ71036.1 TetR/AcrR family transcriptional regulator [Halomonas sp. PA16-9]MCD1585814.1 TetR family transcriptional regulator [Halomonas sp. IOP_14]PKH58075.1 TetR/AcrR family transcriptional regulator [Halomonas sp. Choline-3u-9]QKS26120.1 HTH-type transcriptional repressor NicS [Halomonas titanicae]CDG52697.1 Transcriptional regulator [Halomonas sp. A3H3]